MGTGRTKIIVSVLVSMLVFLHPFLRATQLDQYWNQGVLKVFEIFWNGFVNLSVPNLFAALAVFEPFLMFYYTVAHVREDVLLERIIHNVTRVCIFVYPCLYIYLCVKVYYSETFFFIYKVLFCELILLVLWLSIKKLISMLSPTEPSPESSTSAKHE